MVVNWDIWMDERKKRLRQKKNILLGERTGNNRSNEEKEWSKSNIQPENFYKFMNKRMRKKIGTKMGGAKRESE